LYIAVMFHRARATLCLHSFPTRRSSDLLPQPAGRTALTMELFPLFFTALALGLLGGGHCIGMCGGLMGALTMAIPAQQRRGWPLWRVLLGYTPGRITSYSIAGALLGSIGWLIQDLGLGPLLRTLAGLLMIAMGLYLANWWSGLTRLERLGRGLWKH